MKMLKITLQGKTYEVGVEFVDGAAPRQRLLLQYKRRPLLPLLRRLPPQLQHLHQRLRPPHLQR